MIRRLAVLALGAGIACGGGARSAQPAPESVTEALAQFMAAVRANDLDRMGALWGSARGPASQWMNADVLHKRLSVIQRYLMHVGYRVVEGPVAPPGGDPQRRSFRIELQRQGCNAVLPVDLVRARGGVWLVNDVHLESAGNPAARCAPGEAGTAR